MTLEVDVVAFLDAVGVEAPAKVQHGDGHI